MTQAEPYAGMWDFDGSCAPAEDGSGHKTWGGQETFTLGCFQWVKTARGNRLKKGKVSYRIKGRVESPKEAYEAARVYCAKKNAREDRA